MTSDTESREYFTSAMSASFWLGLDGGERDRIGNRGDRFHVDGDPTFLFRCRVLKMLADDLDDADNVLAFTGMIKARSPLFILIQILLGRVVANAGQAVALGADFHLFVPGP